MAAIEKSEVMIDLETLGIKPNACILSIGAADAVSQAVRLQAIFK